MGHWNPWHGCHRISPGCLNCYVYRIDANYGRDASRFTLTRDYLLPAERYRAGPKKGRWKLAPEDGVVYACFSSDFFLEEADPHRGKVWDAIRLRSDVSFFIPTKRIHRFHRCIPEDWGEGWPHVTIACTMENQAMANLRLPILARSPIAHKVIIAEPLLEPIVFGPELPCAELVIAGGESGDRARVCDLEWFRGIHDQCRQAGVRFSIKQTGARFRDETGVVVAIPRSRQHEVAKAYDAWLGQS
ncbi:MAG: phage Gp37/Gp68 family protein [Desulfovibrio sp.]|jgi:protein gp37|nr:phage Gp37/Gp68 family protein [Desulfovibrio sp.]